MDKEIVKRLTYWIIRNADSESALLHCDPQFVVNAHSLLHHLAEITKTSDEQMEVWVDAARETL